MKRMLSAFTLATLLIAPSLFAQGGQNQATPVPLAPGPTDPNLLRMARIGLDSSMLQRNAQVLFDSIGPRLGGTQGQRSAVEWAVKTLNSWGIEAKQERYGTW